MTYPSGRVVQQTYDSFGRLNTVTSAGSTIASSFAYNAAGQGTAFSHGNGVSARSASTRTTCCWSSSPTPRLRIRCSACRSATRKAAPAQLTRKITASETPAQDRYGACVIGELITYFVGNEDRAGLTTVVHVAVIAKAMVKRGAKYTAGAFLPGPGWLYSAVAIAWDVNGALSAHVKCSGKGRSR